LTSPPPHPPPLPAPRGAARRVALLALLLLAGFAALRFTPLADRLHRETLVALFDTLRTSWWAPVALVALFLVISPLGIPVSPLVLVGGLVFGVVWGSALNFAGCFGGAAVSYTLARLLGRDFVVHLTRGRLARVERLLSRRGFWPLARIRFLPIPFALVNYGAALAGMPPGVFYSATAVGLARSNLVYTYFAALLFRVTGERRGPVVAQAVAVFALMILLTYLPKLWVGMRRRRRLRELTRARAARHDAGRAAPRTR
jgi:uncharacterized membrane protein YdjX (TVP38/TMEM64 family)